MFKKILEHLIFLHLFLCGVALVAIALYSQSGILTELEAHSISFYKSLKYSLISRGWWFVVGSPFIVGLLFIAISFKVSKTDINSKNTQRLFLIILCVSIFSIPFTMVEGYICTITSAICLILQTINKKHNNSLQPTAESGG